MKGCKPNRAHPNPRDGIGIVRGCGERYECKAEKTMHRCARHRAELRGLRQQFKGSPLLPLLVRAQKKNKSLKDLLRVTPDPANSSAA